MKPLCSSGFFIVWRKLLKAKSNLFTSVGINFFQGLCVDGSGLHAEASACRGSTGLSRCERKTDYQPRPLLVTPLFHRFLVKCRSALGKSRFLQS